MILSHKHKFIFICNGKTGTTSLEAKIGHLDESDSMNSSTGGLWVGKHMPPAVIKALLEPSIWESYFKFVFVRHPFDWFVSQYRFNFKAPKIPFREIWSEPWRAHKFAKHYFHNRRLAKKSVYYPEDVYRVAELLKKYKGYPNTETRYQSSYVSDIHGNCLVDYVGRFENLTEDIRAIDQRIGNIIGDIPHLNCTNHKHYDNHITPKAKEAIRKIWKVDFERFGYN